MADEQGQAEKLYAVILHSDGTFATEAFENIEAMVARLKELIDRDVSVACFSGVRLNISKPPMRYLMTPAENIPLFDTAPVIEPDDTGYLGLDPAHLEDPPQLSVPPVGRPTPASDEFFSDDDEGAAINIFDNALPDPDS
jgi:hypothetical protein